ncbi:Hypothetical predicted protein [Podarcis lilfordi]|uniref:Uncharacterized protein n=1 Tax=Podarcis lilfordi TaxID=74358 RepID=A0AA35K1J9_9SAUR|nr:Hypothetical predicted protein [Podarcis lilfordi]
MWGKETVLLKRKESEAAAGSCFLSKLTLILRCLDKGAARRLLNFSVADKMSDKMKIAVASAHVLGAAVKGLNIAVPVAVVPYVCAAVVVITIATIAERVINNRNNARA